MTTTSSLGLFLDTNGDGTGSKNANVDGSVTPVEFKLTIPSGYRAYLSRMIVHIRDSGSIDAGSYGNGITMSNGLQVEYTYRGRSIDLLDGMPIQTNADWGRVCYDVSNTDFGSGDNFVQVRWTFAKAGGPLPLSGGQEFIVRVRDNLSGLEEHTFSLQGQFVNYHNAGALEARILGA